MSLLLGQLVSGAVGLAVARVLFFTIPDWRHRRQCLRRFDEAVRRLDTEGPPFKPGGVLPRPGPVRLTARDFPLLTTEQLKAMWIKGDVPHGGTE